MKATLKRIMVLAALLMLIASIGLTGCTKKPSQEELQKLEEAKQAAEDAEQKLADLRSQRSSLESQLETKKEELRKAEEERDAIKQKLGK
ncbi:MAG: hypothetical protein ACLFQK_09535 [Fibrobacterota bacterium]